AAFRYGQIVDAVAIEIPRDHAAAKISTGRIGVGIIQQDVVEGAELLPGERGNRQGQCQRGERERGSSANGFSESAQGISPLEQAMIEVNNTQEGPGGGHSAP